MSCYCRVGYISFIIIILIFDYYSIYLELPSKVCSFFSNGDCFKGSDCRYIHNTGARLGLNTNYSTENLEAENGGGRVATDNQSLAEMKPADNFVIWAENNFR